MNHLIEFRLRGRAEVEMLGHVHLERLVIAAGTRLRARIKPHVLETTQGPVEAADLYLEDGSVARGVRFASFRFLDA